MPAATAPPPLDALVDATPASRDRSVDLLRAVAIGVVVLWHWVFSVTHWTGDGRLTMPNPIGDVAGLWLATWLLQVMPLFFVVGGVANRAAWTAARRDGRSAADFVRARLLRLARPCVLFVGAWATFEAAVVLLVPRYPGVLAYGRVVLVPLWFLAVYAGVVALVPATATLHARRPGWTLAGLLAAVAAADLGRIGFGIHSLGVVSTVGVWLFAHQLGYWWRDGSLLRGGARTARRVAAVGLAGLVALTTLGPYPRSMVAVRGEGTSNMLPTTLCVAALAVLQLGVALWLRDPLNRWLRRRRPWRAVVAVNGVAMTLFCWHMTALLLAIGAWELFGGTLSAEPTAAWWALRPVWLVLPALFLVPFVAVLGPRERPRH
jgi:peptidoglycan/LPS O-acetylase OafA/YrhL